MIQYILTDIEGTTTSVSFVFDTLFPYFLEHIGEVKSNLHQDKVRQQIAAAKATVLEEEQKQITDDEAIDYIVHWCKTDRKHPALKTLQGIIWDNGYKNGQLKGHLYPEVAEQLKAWKNVGLKLGIYSSGSVPAQKLLFGYSEAGDLTPLFSDYFDTAVGHKREQQSYSNIKTALGLAPENILFLSDITEELDAAKAAGMQTVQLVRPGTTAGTTHPTAADFNEVDQLINK